MRDDKDSKAERLHSLLSSLAFFCFGVALLIFLVAIDRPHWFSLRPASGVAQAMWLASDTDAGDQRRPTAGRGTEPGEG